MSEVLLTAAGMGISASWLILAIIFIRAVFKNMPKKIRCVLWGLVAVRLLCPVFIESRFSLVPDRSITMYQTGWVRRNIQPLNNCLSAAVIIWLLGMIVLLVFAAVSHIRTKRSVREAVLFEGNIFLCDSVKSPFVIGILYPKIYLPSDLGINDNGVRSYVIAHEKAHIKRLDCLWKLISYLVLSAYWWNPLVWAAYFLFDADMEMACDEMAIKGCNGDERKSYANALLSLSIKKRTVLSYTLTFGKIAVKERVKAVLDYEKAGTAVYIISVIACLIIAACFMTNPAKRPGYVRLQTAVMPSEPIKVVTFDVMVDENEKHQVNITARQSGPDVFLYFDSDFDESSAEYTVSFKEDDR